MAQYYISKKGRQERSLKDSIKKCLKNNFIHTESVQIYIYIFFGQLILSILHNSRLEQPDVSWFDISTAGNGRWFFSRLSGLLEQGWLDGGRIQKSECLSLWYHAKGQTPMLLALPTRLPVNNNTTTESEEGAAGSQRPLSVTSAGGFHLMNSNRLCCSTFFETKEQRAVSVYCIAIYSRNTRCGRYR